MSRQVSQDQLARLQAQLEAAEHATKVVPLSTISLSPESLKKGVIEIGGNQVKVGPSFFGQLARHLKLSTTLTNDFMKNEDGKIAAALMNGLKEYRSSRGGGDVMLIANGQTREIVDLCDPKRYNRMTNSSVLDLAGRILDESPKMLIETVDFDPGSGKLAINLLNGNEIGFPKAGKDEYFKFGFSIIQTRKGTHTEMYNQRLVCSNGMRASLGSGAIGGNTNLNFVETYRLAGTKAEDIRHFLEHVERMKQADFVPASFQATLNQAVETKASLAEVEKAMHLAQSHVREQDPGLRKQFIDAVAYKYFDGYGDALARVVKKGWDPSRLSDKQRAHIRTGQSVWDVVNSLTYLGSNNSGLPMENKHSLKFEAGQLFSKGCKDGYDLQFSELAKL
jgi:hypothetical protein